MQQAPKPVSQDEWHVYFTPYAWLPSTLLDITVPEVTLRDRTIGGDISINEPWWNVIGKLGHKFYVLAVDGRVEAWKGRWGGFFDGYWTAWNRHWRFLNALRHSIQETASNKRRCPWFDHVSVRLRANSRG